MIYYHHVSNNSLIMVIIGLSGTKCWGKKTVAKILVNLGFELIDIANLKINEIKDLMCTLQWSITQHFVLCPIISPEIAKII